MQKFNRILSIAIIGGALIAGALHGANSSGYKPGTATYDTKFYISTDTKRMYRTQNGLPNQICMPRTPVSTAHTRCTNFSIGASTPEADFRSANYARLHREFSAERASGAARLVTSELDVSELYPKQ